MAAALRLAVIASLVLALCGCNQVVSSEPWFTETDTDGAPQLRDGLWLFGGDPDCHFDEAKPAEHWPDCATAFVVQGKEWSIADWETQGEGRKARRIFSKWESFQHLLAGGKPLILQWKNEGDPSSPGAADTDSRVGPNPYQYVAIRPLRFDGTGKVIRFEIWPVQCGPLAKSDSMESQDYVTDKPFPGLTVIENDCVARNQGAVREAARLSEALSEAKPIARWLRDGYR